MFKPNKCNIKSSNLCCQHKKYVLKSEKASKKYCHCYNVTLIHIKKCNAMFVIYSKMSPFYVYYLHNCTFINDTNRESHVTVPYLKCEWHQIEFMCFFFFGWRRGIQLDTIHQHFEHKTVVDAVATNFYSVDVVCCWNSAIAKNDMKYLAEKKPRFLIMFRVRKYNCILCNGSWLCGCLVRQNEKSRKKGVAKTKPIKNRKEWNIHF